MPSTSMTVKIRWDHTKTGMKNRGGYHWIGCNGSYHQSPQLRQLPFILETPNDDAGYAAEIALLRAHYQE